MMKILLSFPHKKQTAVLDTISYDPAQYVLDSYIIKLQTWPIFNLGKWYKASNRSYWATQEDGTVAFVIEVEEVK